MRALALGVIGLLVGVGLGVFLAVSQGWEMAGHAHNHGAPAQHGAGAGHDHGEMLDVSGPDAPRLEVQATPDAMTGWNLQLDVLNFAFAPGAASGAHVLGEGHAHVYLDGVKLGRFYGPWVHVPENGDVRVTLNSNDHRALSVDGVPVAVDLVLD